MAEFRWIKMSLFLILELQITVVTGQTSLYTVRDGDDATLPCENVVTVQDKCGSTSWIFVSKRKAVELIRLGQIGEKVKDQSDRLSVTANGSLVIKKVTVEDVGAYTCRQYKSGQQQGQDYRVDLSVVTMTEHKDNDKVMLNCTVLTRGECDQTVKWVYEGNDWDVNIQHMNESQSSCFATVTFTTSHLAETSKYSESFKCNVTDFYTGKVHLFAFSPQSSGEDTTTTKSTKTTKLLTTSTPTTTTNDPKTKQVKLRFIIVSMGLTALIIIVVSVNIWTRIKGNKLQMGDNALHKDEDGNECLVNYENVGGPFASVRLN
ncbi:uncharacterized protein [Thunnus thynnus]|uniref:uncharacterized protein n=1 Tax=Thunnus thynnus TaxID=8237 RepID=UPI0035296F0A